NTSDFTLSPQRYYQDKLGVQWPIAWSMDINGEILLINALLDDQTIDLSVRYWEGLVEVVSPTGARLGRGYMELTGYEDDGQP
ncbi:MAG: lipocalin family protein, partial [Proteobacteria bacterium]|nr:lipocalin family protein [Pseudomonadota bacterium]